MNDEMKIVAREIDDELLEEVRRAFTESGGVTLAAALLFCAKSSDGWWAEFSAQDVAAPECSASCAEGHLQSFLPRGLASSAT